MKDQPLERGLGQDRAIDKVTKTASDGECRTGPMGKTGFSGVREYVRPRVKTSFRLRPEARDAIKRLARAQGVRTCEVIERWAMAAESFPEAVQVGGSTFLTLVQENYRVVRTRWRVESSKPEAGDVLQEDVGSPEACWACGRKPEKRGFIWPSLAHCAIYYTCEDHAKKTEKQCPGAVLRSGLTRL